MSATPQNLAAPPAAPDPLAAKLRHNLILRDTLTFLTLTAITVVLFLATLFLFRSFQAHQHALAIRWSDRGRADLAAGHPETAVTSLRTALTFAPGERSYEMLLAQALGDAGHLDESFNYFTGLWDAQPGDGFINLRLARLAAAKGERDQAINFYRASIYGTWPGDAIPRREATRLELAGYLIAQKNLAAARTELLITGSNGPRDPALKTRLAGLLAEAGDARDALLYDTQALADDPHNLIAATDAARLSSSLGDFAQARTLVERALHIATDTRPQPTTAIATLQIQHAALDRLLVLDPARSLPASERVSRILVDAAVARTRLTSCLATAAPSTSLAGLAARWSVAAPLLKRRTLLASPDLQGAALDLLFTTETATAAACGQPSGDDALLLRLAAQPTNPQP